MREPFEIVDPIESFTEAREAVSAGPYREFESHPLRHLSLLHKALWVIS